MRASVGHGAAEVPAISRRSAEAASARARARARSRRRRRATLRQAGRPGSRVADDALQGRFVWYPDVGTVFAGSAENKASPAENGSDS